MEIDKNINYIDLVNNNEIKGAYIKKKYLVLRAFHFTYQDKKNNQKQIEFLEQCMKEVLFDGEGFLMDKKDIINFYNDEYYKNNNVFMPYYEEEKEITR